MINTAKQAARQAILNKVLLYKEVTRSQLSESLGLSAPVVTEHTRWLLDRRYLQGKSVRVHNVKRPVQRLRLSAGIGTCLAVHLGCDGVSAELVDANGSPIHEQAKVVTEGGQHALLAALNDVVGESLVAAATEDRSIASCALSVNGVIAPEPAIVFSVDGMKEWRTCQPGKILPELSKISEVVIWTDTACKLRGFAEAVQCDHRLGYVVREADQFHVATMQHGQLDYGWYGTGSLFLHQSMASAGPRCYCGRTSCLADAMERGDVPHKQLAAAVPRLMSQLKTDRVGLQWPGNTAELEQSLRDAGVDEVQIIDNPDELQRQGLRSVAAQAALDKLFRQELNA